MVRISEIINRDDKTDLIDLVKDPGGLTYKVWDLYKNLTYFTNNFVKLPHDMSNNDTGEIYNIKHELSLIKDVILEIYGEKSTVRKMVEEMILYFDWFD